MQDPQGQVQTPPATDNPQGQVQTPPADGLPVQQQPDTPPAAQQGQAQGQVDPNVQAVIQLANQRQAEIYRLQQQVEQLSQRFQQQQPQAPQNPFDPNTQGLDYWKWEQNRLAEEASQRTAQNIISSLMQFQAQQSESQWQAAHPQYNIDLVKEFARVNFHTQTFTPQVLDNAVALMNLPQTTQTLTTQTGINTVNQFMRPNSAQPVHGGQPATNQIPQASFEKDMAEYIRTNGRVEASWPKERQEAFKLEWARREEARRKP